MKQLSIGLLKTVTVITLAFSAFFLLALIQAYFGLLGDMNVQFQVFGFSFISDSQDGLLNAVFFLPFVLVFFITAIGTEFLRNRIRRE